MPITRTNVDRPIFPMKKSIPVEKIVFDLPLTAGQTSSISVTVDYPFRVLSAWAGNDEVTHFTFTPNPAALGTSAKPFFIHPGAAQGLICASGTQVAMVATNPGGAKSVQGILELVSLDAPK